MLAGRSAVISCSKTAPVTSFTARTQTDDPFGGAAMGPNIFADLAKRTGQSPKWNFHKYLISRDGKEVQSFASDVDPSTPAFAQGVERLLSKP